MLHRGVLQQHPAPISVVEFDLWVELHRQKIVRAAHQGLPSCFCQTKNQRVSSLPLLDGSEIMAVGEGNCLTLEHNRWPLVFYQKNNATDTRHQELYLMERWSLILKYITF